VFLVQRFGVIGIVYRKSFGVFIAFSFCPFMFMDIKRLLLFSVSIFLYLLATFAIIAHGHDVILAYQPEISDGNIFILLL